MVCDVQCLCTLTGEKKCNILEYNVIYTKTIMQTYPEHVLHGHLHAKETGIMKFAKKYYPLAIAPIITAVIMLVTFSHYNMYPFGNGSVAWCDANQQQIPLLMTFKDVLSGEDSLFFSMQQAGGMSLWGVFCFFLANPFSFLVAFVPKEDVILFMNVLVMLKLITCSFTAALYFTKSKKNLDGMLSVALSIMYALCGYGMLFNQNLMWLDIMYMFPLLLMGLERITSEKKSLLYTLSLAAVVIMNYYIGYMAAVFILLYLMVYYFYNRSKKESRTVMFKVMVSTFIAALISAFVWLPSLLQVSSSGRVTSITDNISNANFLTSYWTVIPLLFCTAFLVPVVGWHAVRGKSRTQEQNRNLILFGLTLIPFFIEPVNMMWHTGDYMSFPARYAFITVFMGLVCCADFFSQDKDEAGTAKYGKSKKLGIVTQIIALIPAIAAIGWYAYYTNDYIGSHFDTVSHYTSSLWGDKSSFDHLSRLFVVTVLCYIILFVLNRKKYIIKPVFALLVALLCAFESVNSIRIYMVSPAEKNPARTQEFIDISDLSGKIEDKGSFRVTTDVKAADYNMTGALGYLSLGHYTSLTNHDFMVMQRLFGYSTVWMKSGSNGGTELTDALYAVKYRIAGGSAYTDSVYSNNRFSIIPAGEYCPMGIVCDRKILSAGDIPSDMTRAQVQQYLFENAFSTGKKLITEYKYNEKKSNGISYSEGKYRTNSNASIVYNLKIKEKQTLYFDCYDRFSNELSEDYFEAFKIRVNGAQIQSKFPSSDNNGLLKLGTFENKDVNIEITSLKRTNVYSFGVFGLDVNMLSSAIADSESAGLTYKGGKLSGSIDSESGKVCLVSIPYSDSLSVKINGSEVEYTKVLSDLVAFELKDGKNDIEITSTPKGFVPGIIISIFGIILLILYTIFAKKLRIPKKLESAAEIIVGLCSVCGAAMIYIFPLVLIYFK